MATAAEHGILRRIGTAPTPLPNLFGPRESLGSTTLGLSGEGFVTLSLSRRPQLIHSEVLFRGKIVMSAATKRHVLDGVLSSPRKSAYVMELQPMRLRAARPRFVGVGAAQSIAFEYGAPNGCRDVTTAPARSCRAVRPRGVMK